jgi:hypothetical protein
MTTPPYPFPPFYRIAYPWLWRRLEYLAARARAADPNVVAIILYGSVARSVADEQSDVDLVILVDDEQAYSSSGTPHAGVRLLTQTYAHVPWPSLSMAWAFSPFVDVVNGPYLTEDLTANIRRDGVLVYRRVDATLPAWATELRPYAEWKDDLATRLQG